MRLLPFALIAAMIGLSTPAYATPVLMQCTLTDKDGPSIFDVQINEEAGTVNYFARRTSFAVTRRAIFTPDLVMFNGFTIDRKSLAFARDDGAAGSCAIDTAKRAF